jgi:PKD repeat protein
MPIPDLFFQSDARSIVVELLFRGKTDVTVNGVTVVPWPSHVSLMDPPQLHIQLEDDFGNPAGERNSWHPLEVESYEGDDHTWSLLDESVGHFAVPFTDGLEWMDFRDVRLDLDLIRVDLKPAIYTFCGANPLEGVCMANFTFPSLIEEGRPAQFTNTSRGPTDGLINAWEWDFGDGTTSTAENPSHIFGDDGTFRVRLNVTDVDGLTDSVIYDITVQNVAPTIHQDVRAFAVVDVTLRVAGEKWHDIRLTVTEDGVPGAIASVTRFPGSPDAQAVTIADQDVILFGPTTGAVVEYTPDDDPVNGQPWGANPVRLILTLEDGSEFEVHHTFNVRHLGTYVWTIDNLLHVIDLIAVPIHFRASATDPGSDDLTFTWDWGDHEPIVSTKYFNDPVVGDDPFPSPEINPRNVTDDVTHTFAVAGTYLVTLTVEDDDGGVDLVMLRVEI